MLVTKSCMTCCTEILSKSCSWWIRCWFQ